jgi:pteridine reductase
MSETTRPVALITGAARRIGAAIARGLHSAGHRVVLHHRHSASAAAELAVELNASRPDSAATISADLLTETGEAVFDAALAAFGRLDVLINNASSFYPTPVGEIEPSQWDDLMGSNARAPLFLSQAASAELAARQGVIINILDIHARSPLAGHPVYAMAKAALDMMTRSLARELAPAVRVNGVSPGAILWPDAGLSEDVQRALIKATPLKRRGDPQDIADAVVFLVGAGFITGQVLAVDGGRSLKI